MVAWTFSPGYPLVGLFGYEDTGIEKLGFIQYNSTVCPRSTDSVLDVDSDWIYSEPIIQPVVEAAPVSTEVTFTSPSSDEWRIFGMIAAAFVTVIIVIPGMIVFVMPTVTGALISPSLMCTTPFWLCLNCV